jgi:hypothetical protein
MPFTFPTAPVSKLKRLPLIAPGSFRRIFLYRFRGIKPGPKRPARSQHVTEQKLDFPHRKNHSTNVLFRYLYRDASNYKLYGEAIFTNQTFLPLAEIEQQVRASLKDGEFFIAQQVRIEERFFDTLHDDDHPWHTFEKVETTPLAPFDPDNWAEKQHRRDITEFILELEQAKKSGWDEMNVRKDLKQLLEGERQKLRQSIDDPALQG